MKDLVNKIRELNILVIHQRDIYVDELVQQINRIGCDVEHIYSIPTVLPVGTDVILAEIDNEIHIEELLAPKKGRPKFLGIIIGIVAYENPSILNRLINIDADAAITKPLRASGVMTTILMAYKNKLQKKDYFDQILKLTNKFEGVQRINQAKLILMRLHSIDENKAYDNLRQQAMSKRTTILEIASSIINAVGILNGVNDKKS
jgi:AmiR/NasT family two-component response regulator